MNLFGHLVGLFIVVYFIIDSVRKLLDASSYLHTRLRVVLILNDGLYTGLELTRTGSNFVLLHTLSFCVFGFMVQGPVSKFVRRDSLHIRRFELDEERMSPEVAI